MEDTVKYPLTKPGHDVHEDGGQTENAGGADVHEDHRDAKKSERRSAKRHEIARKAGRAGGHGRAGGAPV